jgi:hypothetical protein
MTPIIDNTLTTDTTSATENSLIEQSQILRQQLRAQRKRIGQQIDPVTTVNASYPRSMTMRFITQRPALVAGLVAEVATLFLGARFLKSAMAALSVARIVRSSVNARQKPRLPSP